MRFALLLALALAACAEPPPPPTPPTPTPTPAPPRVVELTAQAHVGAEVVSLRVLTPARGEARAQAALDAATLELKRVGGLLGAESPELAAAEAAAKHAAAAAPDRAMLALGYALDRAAFQLGEAGMTDFLLDGGGGRALLARGAKDAGGGGWNVGVQGPQGTIGTLVLRDQVLATGPEQRRSVLAPSAATGLAATVGTGFERIEVTDGGWTASPGFERLFEPLPR